jgi:predicted lipoprotein
LLASDVALRLTELEALWVDGYAEQLDGTVSSSAYPELAVAIDALVNAMIAGLHDIDDHKLGDPLAAGSTTGPAPDLVESRFSDRSLVDARDGLVGFSQVYLGDDERVGLTILVSQASPEIDTNVRAAIEQAEQALAAVPEPLRESVSADADSVTAAVDAVVQLRMLMSVDVAGLLGVTVSLSDNDGD